MICSILIANYNNGKYITEAIESVKKQTYTNWEIIIVDDASTDNSIQIINKLKKEIANLRLFIHENNLGCGATKDDCVKFANGDICGFLDPDDVISDNALEVMVNEHYKNPDCSLIHSNFYYCNKNLNVKKAAHWVKQVPPDKTNLHFNCVSHFASFKREKYFQTEGINRNLKSAVDKDLYYKLEEVGKLKYIDEVLYFARENEQGLSQYNNFVNARKNTIQVIKNTRKRRKKNGFKNINFIEYLKKHSIAYSHILSYLVNNNKSKTLIIKYLLMSFITYPFHLTKQRIRTILYLLNIKI